MIIQLEQVKKQYKMGPVIVNALKEVNLAIEKGEFISIMGPSGSGKSTMMNLVGCLDIPSFGKISLDGYNISELTESDLASIRGKKIGYIFQKFNLIPTLTALENVMLPMMFQNIPIENRKKIATELLDMVHLSHRLNHKPNEMSGGEQQRVAIARALSNNPDIILADEPTGNLDSKTGKEIMQFLTELNKQGKTIILVTHDPSVAEYADKIYNLRDGEIKYVN
ncbi:MAG: ABC transporter ATP-binding protein [Candidatus Nanoarchaeia archaeon]|nr:ABC transporter ATP-binding protein [Candidatus Nanoarchaeia archaeon]